MTVGSPTVNPVSLAQTLDAVFDDELKPESMYHYYVGRAIVKLFQLRHSRRYLDFDSASTVVNIFVTSRIDYRNALLLAARCGSRFYSTSALKYQIDELQRFLNWTPNLSLKPPRFERRLRSMVEERLH